MSNKTSDSNFENHPAGKTDSGRGTPEAEGGSPWNSPAMVARLSVTPPNARLARSCSEFRAAVREAARVARCGAPLFVFTFARATLPPEAISVEGEPFVFTQFSGTPQCFLTEAQLIEELRHAGFEPELESTIKEYCPFAPGKNLVILEGIFRRCDASQIRAIAASRTSLKSENC